MYTCRSLAERRLLVISSLTMMQQKGTIRWQKSRVLYPQSRSQQRKRLGVSSALQPRISYAMGTPSIANPLARHEQGCAQKSGPIHPCAYSSKPFLIVQCLHLFLIKRPCSSGRHTIASSHLEQSVTVAASSISTSSVGQKTQHVLSKLFSPTEAIDAYAVIQVRSIVSLCPRSSFSKLISIAQFDAEKISCPSNWLRCCERGRQWWQIKDRMMKL